MTSPAPKTGSIAPRDYDERIYRKGNPPHRARIALIAILALAIGTYFAWTKELPFGNPYELKAVFANAVKIRTDSPVRVAGVNVGKVVKAERVDGVSEVTFTVDPEGQPVHDDAYAQIRPRIFLEGNFFIDLRPGSPGTAELSSGDTIPVTQTDTAVQIDEVLTALQSDDRQNLVETLAGLGTALNEPPSTTTTADTVEMSTLTGGQALNEALDYGGQAGRDSAIVSEAFRGTDPTDLRRLLRSLSVVTATLAANESSVQGLLSNYATFTGALAAESRSLKQTVANLAPTLRHATPALLHVNLALPALRAWTRDITPGLRALPSTITSGTPWLTQTSTLLGPVAQPPATPTNLGWTSLQLKNLAQPAGKIGASGPGAFEQAGLFAKCGSDVLIPTGNQQIDNAEGLGGYVPHPSYMDFFYGAVNLAGSGQGFDGNGRYLRTQAGGGPIQISGINPGSPPPSDARLWGSGIAVPLGTRPVLDSSGGTTLPAFNASQACYLQDAPDLNGAASAIGAPSPEQLSWPNP